MEGPASRRVAPSYVNVLRPLPASAAKDCVSLAPCESARTNLMFYYKQNGHMLSFCCENDVKMSVLCASTFGFSLFMCEMWNVVVSMTCALGSEVNVLLNACCVHSLMAVLKMERSIQPNMDPPPLPLPLPESCNCLNGGICSDGGGCACPVGYSGDTCQDGE